MAKKVKKNIGGLCKRPWFVTVLLGLLLVVSFMATFYFIFLRSSPPPASLLLVPAHNHPPLSIRIITSTPKKRRFMAKVAIVIDDIGNQKRLGEGIMDLDLNLSFSILPYRPFSKLLSQKAVGLGRDVLLHLPMEALDHKWNPGQGALWLSMSKTDIFSILDADLAQLPMVIGINNHMGSRFTEDRGAMGIFLTALRHKDLFWLDSLTSSNSVGFKMAREMGLRTAKRDVFLDNIQESDKIILQLNKLLNIARCRGYAIGIAHPHQETLKALQQYQHTLQQEVMLVGISKIIKIVNPSQLVVE